MSQWIIDQAETLIDLYLYLYLHYGFCRILNIWWIICWVVSFVLVHCLIDVAEIKVKFRLETDSLLQILSFMFQHLSNVRPVSIKDMEKFTSPWAVAAEDEEKFSRTVSSVGRLLRDDLHLQVTKHTQKKSFFGFIIRFFGKCFLTNFKIQFVNSFIRRFK